MVQVKVERSIKLGVPRADQGKGSDASMPEGNPLRIFEPGC